MYRYEAVIHPCFINLSQTLYHTGLYAPQSDAITIILYTHTCPHARARTHARTRTRTPTHALGYRLPPSPTVASLRQTAAGALRRRESVSDFLGVWPRVLPTGIKAAPTEYRVSLPCCHPTAINSTGDHSRSCI